MILLSSNNATTVLGAGISSGTTTIPLATGTGALFPSPGANEYFTLTLNDALTGNRYETTWCTARTGDSCTVVRGQEGSTAQSWLIGDFAYNTETAVSISTARAYSATNQPTLPFTIPAAHQGVTQIVPSSGTLTLPNTSGIQDGYLCTIIAVNNGTVVTVNTNSANVGLPGGAVVNTTFSFSGTLNQISLQWDAGATVWLPVGASPNFYPLPNIVVITSSGTYTSSAGARYIIVEAVGSGGAGGGNLSTSSTQSVAGAGGGGGAYARVKFTSGFSGGLAVTIPAGGAGVSGAGGNAGGATVLGSILSVDGGGGGQVGTPDSVPSTSGSGGIGGSTITTTGQLIASRPGKNGGRGTVLNTGATGGVLGAQPGDGGDSFYGVGNYYVTVGVGWGAGGSGSSAAQSAAAGAGASGASGGMVIYEYFS